MASIATIDWSECPFVESKPGVLSGDIVLSGTRMPVEAIVDNFAWGLTVAEIAEQFQLPEYEVRAVLAYGETHRIAHSV